MKIFTYWAKLRSINIWGVAPRVRLYTRMIANARDRELLEWASYLEGRLQRKYGVFLSSSARFPPSLSLKHPVGIVIGKGVTIGERVTIYQNVTIGGARSGDGGTGNYPVIGDDTVLFAGSVIIGNVKIGKGCIIGANSVVTKDVSDGCTVAGAPARVIKAANPVVS